MARRPNAHARKRDVAAGREKFPVGPPESDRNFANYRASDKRQSANFVISRPNDD
jgi:hypothetical protein